LTRLSLKYHLPIIIAVAVCGLVISLYLSMYESKYITVKLSGDADEFAGFINILNDKGEIEGITLENELPQENKLKTQKLYCRIELISGEYIIVEYWTKGQLIREDTVNHGVYKRNISVEADED
jgi:hypothetical protein